MILVLVSTACNPLLAQTAERVNPDRVFLKKGNTVPFDCMAFSFEASQKLLQQLDEADKLKKENQLLKERVNLLQEKCDLYKEAKTNNELIVKVYREEMDRYRKYWIDSTENVFKMQKATDSRNRRQNLMSQISTLLYVVGIARIVK